MAAPKMRFGEPPPERTTAFDWSAIAAKLKARPNEWAEVFTKNRYSLVASITSESITVFQSTDEGSFATRTSNNHVVVEGDGVSRRLCDLWMCWVPATKKGK